MAQSPAVLTGRPPSWRGAWSWALVGVVAVLGGYVVLRDRHDLGSALHEIGWGSMLASWLFALLGTIALLGLWVTVLGALGADVRARQAWRVFFISQLGKYLPGLVWPALAQMEAGHRWGVRRRVMLAANLLMITVLAGSGLVVGLLLVSVSVGLGDVPRWAVLAAAALVAVCLWPGVLTALLDRVFVAMRREPPGLVVDTRRMLVAFGWSLVIWALYGVHIWLLSSAVGATGATALAAAVGGIALGWALGLLAVVSPAGVGVRDATILAVLVPVVGRSPALAIALASRVMLALADVVLAGVAALRSAARSADAQE